VKSPITTHVLDTSIGRPAAGVPVVLYRVSPSGDIRLGEGATDSDGRILDLCAGPLEPGRFRITFVVGPYFFGRGVSCFFPEVSILFEITDASQHHHVPLLLSPFGYSTYRGS